MTEILADDSTEVKLDVGPTVRVTFDGMEIDGEKVGEREAIETLGKIEENAGLPTRLVEKMKHMLTTDKEAEEERRNDSNGATLEFEDDVFSRWTKYGNDRLYVRRGDGYVDVETGEVGESLNYEGDAELVTRDEGGVLVVEQSTGASATEVARVPKED